MVRLGLLVGIIVGTAGFGLPLNMAPALGLSGLAALIHIHLGSSVYVFGGLVAAHITGLSAMHGHLRRNGTAWSRIASLHSRLSLVPGACVVTGMIWTIVSLVTGMQEFVHAVASGAANPLEVLVEEGAFRALTTTAVGLALSVLLPVLKEVWVGHALKERQAEEEHRRHVRTLGVLMNQRREVSPSLVPGR